MNTPVVKRYISVDLATDHGEVVLVTFTDGKPAMETVHSFPIRKVEMAGKTFWNLYSIYDEVIEGLSGIGKRRIQIESIGIDSWSCDFVCLAKDGTFIGLPRCSDPAYTASSQAKFFKKKISASEYYGTTGAQIRDSLTAFQLFAQRKEKNRALDYARNILFICGGAFDGIERKIAQRLNTQVVGFESVEKRGRIDNNNLMKYVSPQDLKSFGMIPEIVGRLPVVTYLQPLDRTALRNILTEPKNSLVRQYEKLFAIDGVNLSFQPAVLDYVVDKAIEFKLGARGLRSIMEAIMMDVMFDLPSTDRKKCNITLVYAKKQLEKADGVRLSSV